MRRLKTCQRPIRVSTFGSLTITGLALGGEFNASGPSRLVRKSSLRRWWGPSSNYLAPAFQLPGGIYTWEGRYGSWPTVDEMLYKADTVRGAPPTEQTIAFHETAKEVFEIQVHQQQHEERARARHLSVFGPHLTKVR